MRILNVIAAVLLVVPPSFVGAAQPLGVIWRDGDVSVIVTPCPPGGDHDDSCRAVEVRRAGRVVRLGGGFMAVTAIPVAAARAGQPDVVVMGDDGGSGGDGNLFAVTVGNGIAVAHLEGERLAGAVVTSVAGRLAIDLPFNIEYFNDAPHAGASIVMVPVVWRDGDFAVDLAALTGRAIAVDAGLMRRELTGWAKNAGYPSRLYPPYAPNGTSKTVAILAGLILSGHADRARTALHHAWPRGVNGARPSGEDAFWTGVCGEMVRHPWWARFGLDRLPHAGLVKAAAAGVRPK